MKLKRFMILGALVGALALTGCYGPQVKVPPGYVAKLSTKDGVSKEIIRPGMFRLKANCIDCDEAILAEVSDKSIVEELEVFMPKDQLKLVFSYAALVRISSEDDVVNNIFDRVPAVPVNPQAGLTEKPERVRIIGFDAVYNTYGSAVVREAARTVVIKYTIAQVQENREQIAAEIFQKIKADSKGTPLEIIRGNLGSITLPEVIANAKEDAANREEKLRAAEANRQLALKQQEIELIEADTQIKVDAKLSSGVSPYMMQMRGLRAFETLAANNNKTVYFLPLEAFSNPAVLTGAVNKGVN